MIVGVHINDLHHVRIGQVTYPTKYAINEDNVIDIKGQPFLVLREVTPEEHTAYHLAAHGCPPQGDHTNYRFFEVTTD